MTLRWAQEHLETFDACKYRRDNCRANLLSNLAILLTSRPYDFVWFAAPILVISVPAFDTFLAVMRRATNEKEVLWGDRRHIYDLLRARGWGDRRTILSMYGLSVALGATALLVTRLRSIPALGLLSLGFLLALWAAHRLGGTSNS